MTFGNDPFLSDAAMVSFTGRRWKSKQISWLKNEGVPFTVSATGHPRVTIAAVERREAVKQDATPRWTPKVVVRGV